MSALPDALLNTPLAHRALHDVAQGRPENSIAAIEAAIAAGYGIEIDVQLSSDGHAMVFHDYALDRLTGEAGPVLARSAVDLAEVSLTGGDEGISTLPQVLALVAGRVPVLIELKDQDGAMGPNVGLLEQATALAIQDYVGPLAVMSFNPHSVAMMQTLSPTVPRGITTSAYRPGEWPLSDAICDHLRGIPDFDRVGASFVSHEVDDLDNPRIGDLRSAGVPILCWTVKSEASERIARRVADNITFEGYLAQLPA